MVPPDDPRILAAWKSAIDHLAQDSDAPSPDDTLDSAGGDSLAYVLLMDYMEETFGVRIDWEAIFRAGLTPRNLARALTEAGVSDEPGSAISAS